MSAVKIRPLRRKPVSLTRADLVSRSSDNYNYKPALNTS